MMTFKFDVKDILIINTFESLTKARVRDCFEDVNDKKRLVFIVEIGDVGKAVGKGGSNVKILSNKFKKEIKIVEYNENVLEFIKNLIYPVKAKNVYEESFENASDSVKNEGKIIVIEVQDGKSKGLLIGRNASTLRSLEEIVRRHFPIEEIKVK